jgi:hypothetical protein
MMVTVGHGERSMAANAGTKVDPGSEGVSYVGHVQSLVGVESSSLFGLHSLLGLHRKQKRRNVSD